MREYTKDIIDHINLFETLTKARVKDCLISEKLIFIVEEGDIGKAVGKNGRNVSHLSKLLKKKIRIIEFNNKIEKFVKNLIYPAEGKIYKEDNSVFIEANNKEKGLIMGRNRENLKELQKILNMYFKVEMKVV
jgi:N utilization substance protein A